ncbi:GumL protein [Rhodococcoides trifolii]|uniref:GumL protein n=1 Tax=Rhodococcoides trifolii TaxID=908250 RepID=A0A917LJ82_9NOCA|nr:polysaccharide pyruvyl transferase family protein [Rhodococcus trifolii]GGG29306.1 GumL protein [Rhodococcus trifolii]
MSEVEVLHWNPSRIPGKVGKVLAPVCGHVDNFGDLLGPKIVRALALQLGIDTSRTARSTRLLAVGSIVKLARSGDVVWGAGINGKSVGTEGDYAGVDVRAVRGPLTARWLRDRGADVPDVYGDPGLLASTLWPETSRRIVTRDYTIIPNIHDLAMYRDHPNTMSPRRSFTDIRSRILASDLVIGSSLHAIVIAESYGIPARLLRSETEPPFKYEDYYLGSGRSTFRVADSVCQALRLGGEKLPEWDAQALTDAFPSELWSSFPTVR